jgi:uncharacterized protein (TIGR03000 family)
LQEVFFMYSLVLMMAMSQGAAVPSFDGAVGAPEKTAYADHGHRLYRGRRGCHGCSGGCSGGGWGCSGGGWGCHGGGWGCYGGGGGCHGGYGCHGGGGGCHGGYGSYGSYGGYGVNTGGYYGGMPYYGEGSYYSGPIYYGEGNRYGGTAYPMPGTTTQGSYPDERGTNRGTGTSGTTNRSSQYGSLTAPAQLIVNLPAEAKLTVDGAATQSTSNERVFESPPLQPDKEFFYNLKATIVRDGRTLTATKRVPVRAGEISRATLDFTEQGGSQQ